MGSVAVRVENPTPTNEAGRGIHLKNSSETQMRGVGLRDMSAPIILLSAVTSIDNLPLVANTEAGMVASHVLGGFGSQQCGNLGGPNREPSIDLFPVPGRKLDLGEQLGQMLLEQLVDGLSLGDNKGGAARVSAIVLPIL